MEKLKALGLDVGVVASSDGFNAAIAPVVGEHGVDMVVDNIGGDVLAPCIDALAVGGRFVSIGRMSGVLTGELNVDRMAERRLHLYGVSNRLRTAAQRKSSDRRFIADLMPALGDGRIRPIIDRSFVARRHRRRRKPYRADRHVSGVRHAGLISTGIADRQAQARQEQLGARGCAKAGRSAPPEG